MSKNNVPICRIKHRPYGFKSAIQPAVKDKLFKSGTHVNPQCGGSGSWNIYIVGRKGKEGGLWESKAWWLEPHSKEMDKGPEDSCSAALSLTKTEKKQKT